MPVFKSNQVTDRDASPRVMAQTNISGGRVRRQGFTVTVPVGGIAIGDTIQLCVVSGGARHFGGRVEHDAVGAATATLSIGDGTTSTKFSAATVVDAAGGFDFGKTIAKDFMNPLTGDLTVTATVGVAGLTAGKVIRGFVEYMAD